jgi:chromatin remodeling complex protein RSC6
MDTNEEVNDKQQGIEAICEQFEGIIGSLSNFKIQMNALQQQLKTFEKSVKKQMTGLQKEITKNKNKNKGNRKPSGFAKPSKVTSELCEFMNKKEGTEIARTEVTKALCSYIKEHNLENKSNSKIIYPDIKLKMLLGIEEGQELTYFTIQKFMNKHFI